MTKDNGNQLLRNPRPRVGERPKLSKVFVYLPPELRAKVFAAADKAGMSVSYYLTRLIEQHVRP
jgi:hypothetical protein